MKKKLIIIKILILSFFFNSNYLYANLQNKIIADVENEIISSYELKNKIRTTIIFNKDIINQESINKTKNQALKALINLKLKKSELKKYGYDSESVNSNNYIERIASKYNTNLDGFKKIFSDNNLDYKLYTDEVKTELTWQQFILALYGEKTIIDEEEIKEELNKIIKSQENVIEYNLSEIELEASNEVEMKNLLKEVKNQIASDSFENTAIKYSISVTAMDGGSLGWINSKALSERILSYVSKLKIGEISEPIQQPNSMILIKLKDKKKIVLDEKNLEITKKNIITQKRNELLNLFSNSHLSKIKNNAYIELR